MRNQFDLELIASHLLKGTNVRNNTRKIAVIVATICLALVQLLTLACVIDANEKVEIYRQASIKQTERIVELSSKLQALEAAQVDDSSTKQTRTIQELADLGYTSATYVGGGKYTAKMGDCLVQAFYYDANGAIPTTYDNELVVDLGRSESRSDLLVGVRRSVAWIDANSGLFDGLLGDLSPCFGRPTVDWSELGAA